MVAQLKMVDTDIHSLSLTSHDVNQLQFLSFTHRDEILFMPSTCCHMLLNSIICVNLNVQVVKLSKTVFKMLARIQI